MKKSNIIFLLLLLFSLNMNGQDWANLNRFKEANMTISSRDSNETKIVFMGNSITEGWLQFNPELFNEKTRINRGISGQTTPQMLLRFRQDVIALHPTLVVILAGTNDLAGNTGPSSLQMIMDNITSMSEIALANGVTPILSSVLPASDFFWNPGLKPIPSILALNKMIKDYCLHKNITYLDYYSSMVDSEGGLKKELTYDGVHPNLLGYQVMEPLLDAAIKKTLEKE